MTKRMEEGKLEERGEKEEEEEERKRRNGQSRLMDIQSYDNGRCSSGYTLARNGNSGIGKKYQKRREEVAENGGQAAWHAHDREERGQKRQEKQHGFHRGEVLLVLVGKSEVVGPKTLEPYLTVISERALLNREIKTRGPTKQYFTGDIVPRNDHYAKVNRL